MGAIDGWRKGNCFATVQREHPQRREWAPFLQELFHLRAALLRLCEVRLGIPRRGALDGAQAVGEIVNPGLDVRQQCLLRVFLLARLRSWCAV